LAPELGRKLRGRGVHAREGVEVAGHGKRRGRAGGGRRGRNGCKRRRFSERRGTGPVEKRAARSASRGGLCASAKPAPEAQPVTATVFEAN